MSLDNKKEVKGQTLEKVFFISFMLMAFISVTIAVISVDAINRSIDEVKEVYDVLKEKEKEEEEKIRQEKENGNYYFNYYIEKYLLGSEYEQEYLGDDFDIEKAVVIDRKDMDQRKSSVIFDYMINGEKHFLYLFEPEKDYKTASYLGKLKREEYSTVVITDTFLINHYLKALQEDDTLKYMELPADSSLIEKECYYIIRDDSKFIDFEINNVFIYKDYKVRYCTEVWKPGGSGFDILKEKTVNEDD